MVKAPAKPLVNSPVVLTRTMVWVFLIGYGVFLVGRSTYQNYKMNQDISYEKQQIATLQDNVKSLELSLVYYRSNSFKEIEARRRLGLKAKDEHVVALPQASSEPSFAIITTPVKSDSDHTKIPPAVAWWRLFFH